MSEQRNLILAVALSLGVLLLWSTFVTGPATEKQVEAEKAAREAAAAVEADPDAPPAIAASPSSAPSDEADTTAPIEAAPRVRIESAALSGSLNLEGARFDDLTLLRYDTVLPTKNEPTPPKVEFLRPGSTQGGYHAMFGWQAPPEEPIAGLPGPRARWTLVEGDVLTPETPIMIELDNFAGLKFRRRISMDDDYLFTIVDEVENRSGAAVELFPYGRIRRNGIPTDLTNFMILHEGVVGVLDGKLIMRKYKKLLKQGDVQARSTDGWVGITDKYWLTAIAPGEGAGFRGQFRTDSLGNLPRFDANVIEDAVRIGDNEIIQHTTRFFAGAKRSELLTAYEETFNIRRFNLAIDWGTNFWFLTKPYFSVLQWFANLTGSFAIAILCLTVLLKAIFFPLANASYKSMARMKAMAPKMQEIKERYGADKERQQKEMIALYQKEKINPVSGCLPMLLQIPVFYALYKTLFVTIEMRHAPFFGWIRDLSASDPTSFWNLFGLMPWDPSGWPILGTTLAIGIWPLLMGVTMAAMQSLNPPPPDEMQRRIFAFMPVVFTIIMAPFAAGLVIYMTWNNILSFAQQYVILRRQNVDTPIGSFIARKLGKKPAEGAAS